MWAGLLRRFVLVSKAGQMYPQLERWAKFAVELNVRERSSGREAKDPVCDCVLDVNLGYWSFAIGYPAHAARGARHPLSCIGVDRKMRVRHACSIRTKRKPDPDANPPLQETTSGVSNCSPLPSDTA